MRRTENRQKGDTEQKRGTKSPRGALLFYVAATMLSLLFIILTVLFIARSRRAFYNYTAEADDILRELNRGRYVEAWNDVRSNRMQGVTEDKHPEYALPYAAADYYEARSLYTAYRAAGERDRAAYYKNEMEEAYDGMGKIQFLADEIDEMFENAAG